VLKTRTFLKSESLSNKGTLLDQYSRLVVIAPKGVANSQNILDGGLAQSCTTFQVPPPCPLLLILGRSSMHLVVFFVMGPRCPNINTGVRGDQLQRVWTSGAGFCYSTVCRFQNLEKITNIVPPIAPNPHHSMRKHPQASANAEGAHIIHNTRAGS